MSDFRKLKVWQKAHALAVRVVRIAGKFKRANPRLSDQMCRSSESIPDAIAEGRGKRTDKDFSHYMTTAISSANELEGQLQRAADLSLISPRAHWALSSATIEVRKMSIGLRKKLDGGD